MAQTPELKRIDPNSLNPLEAAASGMLWQFMNALIGDDDADKDINDDVVFFLRALDRTPKLPDSVVILMQNDVIDNEWTVDGDEGDLRSKMGALIQDAESNWNNEPLDTAMNYLISLLKEINAIKE